MMIYKLNSFSKTQKNCSLHTEISGVYKHNLAHLQTDNWTSIKNNKNTYKYHSWIHYNDFYNLKFKTHLIEKTIR